MKTPTKHAGPNSGFSLVEVTIALAIAAVAIVSLIGMLPSGMNTMVEAGDTAIMARIHQSVLGAMQVTDFEDLNEEFHLEELYYDSQGEQLDSSQEGELEHIYSARIHVPEMVGGSMPESLGGSGYGGIKLNKKGDPNERLQLVIVEIAPAGGRAGTSSGFDWEDEENFRMISTYQTIVADTGDDFGRD